MSTYLRTIKINLRQALTNRSLLGWVGLVSIADLLLDIFLSYSVLYFADVVGLPPAQTSLVLTALMIASLAADLLLIPLLERFPGRQVVRVSAAAALVVYPAFLLVPWIWAKIILVIAIRFTTLGWYPVLKGETYAAAPGRSGTVEAVNSLGGLVSGALAWMVGMAASQFGLSAAMWLLMAAPITLLLGVPKTNPAPKFD
jgi:FSR family fosmidomycin resistance protein-like MFS transporter